MNIQDMKPGRELDRKLAESFGYTVGHGKGGWTGEDVIILRPDDGTSEWLGDGQKPIPPYSTDISAAWEVVEKMKSQGFDICINTVTKRTSDIAGMNRENWHCCILKNETRSRVYAPTAPEAICKVVLMALEGYHETD